MSKNLFRALVESAPINKRLEFGYNENVIIEAIDFNQRKNKGMPTKQHTYIKLSKIDEDKKIIATSELSFWDLDHTKDNTENDFMREFTTLAGAIAAVGGNLEEFEDKIFDAIDAEYKNQEISDIVTSKKGCAFLQKALQDVFKSFIEEFIGIEKSPLFKTKLVVNKNGYLQFPNEMNWIVLIDSDMEIAPITTAERRRKQESLIASRPTKAKADSPTSDMAAEADDASDKVKTKQEDNVASSNSATALMTGI